MYADDVQIYIQVPPSDIQGAITRLNADISNISEWGKAHGLKLSPSKTQVMLLGSRTHLQKVDLNLLQPVSVDAKTLPFLKKVKNLGVFFDETLTGNLWVNDVTRGVMAALNRFYRCGASLMPLRARRALVNALILPKFDYGGALHARLSAENTSHLHRIQNSCVRFVYRLPRREPLNEAYKDWGFLRLQERRVWQMLVIFYKSVVLNMGPPYLQKKFQRFSCRHSHGTRNRKHHFILPTVRTAAFTTSFKYSAAKEWNELPASIYLNKEGGYVTPNVFKKRLKRHLLGEYAG